MGGHWDQQNFVKKLSQALLVAKDAILKPTKSILHISEPLRLDGFYYSLCFISRHKNADQLVILQQNYPNSNTARLESQPRMNSPDFSVLTHFGLPCSLLLYSYADDISSYPMHNLPSTSQNPSIKTSDSLLQLLEYLAYSAAALAQMEHMYPFLVQLPVQAHKNLVFTFAFRGWYGSHHMVGLINGSGVMSSFGIGEMKRYSDTYSHLEDTKTHQHTTLSTNYALAMLQDAQTVMNRTGKRNHGISPIPLLSYYYVELLADDQGTPSNDVKLPYGGRLAPRQTSLQSSISLSDIKDFVTDALGRSKSQYGSTRSTVKTSIASLTKSLKTNLDELLWPLTDVLPKDMNNNIYLSIIHPKACKYPAKSQLSRTLSTVIPLDFPLTSHIPKVYSDGLISDLAKNFGSAWKIFANLPAEALLRGKAIESVSIHWYSVDLEHNFPSIYLRIIQKLRQNLEAESAISILSSRSNNSDSEALGKMMLNIAATNAETYDRKWAPAQADRTLPNNQEISYLKYAKKIREYRHARALEHRRNFAFADDMGFPLAVPAGLILKNPLRVLSVAIHFGLAAIESFGSEKADIDEAPVWVFSPLLTELFTVKDYHGMVSGCTTMIELLSTVENYVKTDQESADISTSTLYLSNAIYPITRPVTLDQQRASDDSYDKKNSSTAVSGNAFESLIDHIFRKRRVGDGDGGVQPTKRRRQIPFKPILSYSTKISQQMCALQSIRHCPENCFFCRLAGVVARASDANGMIILLKSVFHKLQAMMDDGEPVPFVEYTFNITMHHILYQSIVKANQCLRLYQAINEGASSTSFDESGKTLAAFRLNKVTLSLPSPTLRDLIEELSMNPSETQLYSLLCKSFLCFVLQSGSKLVNPEICEEDLVTRALEHVMSRGDYAGYAHKSLVDMYPELCKSSPYTDTPRILTEETLGIVPIGRMTGALTFIPKANSKISESTPYLCLVYPYPNHFVEECMWAVVRAFVDIRKKNTGTPLLEQLHILRESAADQDYREINQCILEELGSPEQIKYILYVLTATHAMNYAIEVSELGFELLSEKPLFNALLSEDENEDENGDKASHHLNLHIPKLSKGTAFLSPLEPSKIFASTSKTAVQPVNLVRCLAHLSQECVIYYRREYTIACSWYLSEMLSVSPSLAYTMCFQPVALDPGERDVAFKRVEKQMIPLFWEATLLTNFTTNRDTQYHRCYMQFLKPSISNHIFTPTFQHCVAFTLSRASVAGYKSA